jgi:hypothetical protein
MIAVMLQTREKGDMAYHLVISLVVLLSLIVGAGYAWTYTPSYSLYQIRHALETHDYNLFTRYVDVDSVLDHALDELGTQKEHPSEDARPRGFLGKLARKGLFKLFTNEARDLTKVGLALVIEQAIKDPDRPLPDIPLGAVAAALWVGQRDGETIRFPVKVKKSERIQVRVRQSAEGVWRVVEVENLPVLLPVLQRQLSRTEREYESDTR